MRQAGPFGNTPFMWTKQVASNFGGLPQWPDRLRGPSALRPPTKFVRNGTTSSMSPQRCLMQARLPEPKSVNGVAQTPIEGVCMIYTFDDATAVSSHKTQYFEIFANRGIYHDGWFAGTVHKAPWETKPRAKLLDDSGNSTTPPRTSVSPTTLLPPIRQSSRR